MTSWNSRLKLYQKNPNTLFLENVNEFGNFTNIPDGNKFRNKYYVLANEIPGYLSISEDYKLNNLTVEKSVYSTLYEYNKQNIELFTLGRYFGSKLDNYVEKDAPRRYLQNLILENKKINRVEKFIDWTSHLQYNLGELIYFVMKKSSKNNFLITSIPNSNGENRFESFLSKVCNDKRFKNFKIEIATNLFHTKVHQNTMYKPESEKLYILRNAYSLNKEYISFVKNIDCHILIIDDVFTTGTHLKVAIEKINEYINIDKEFELLKALANAGTKYVADAIIMNRIRKGINVDEIREKYRIQDIYNKSYIKKLINKKELAFSGLFLAATQNNAVYNLEEGSFHSLDISSEI